MAGEGRFAYQSPQSQAALEMNERGITCPDPRPPWRLWVHFLDTASAQLMFTDGIDELLNINLCRSNIFNGLYNGNFLLIKLPKCFLTP